MKQGIQDTFEEESPIRKWGCYFLSLIEWGVRNGAKENDTYALSLFAGDVIRFGWMNKEFTVLQPTKILALADGPKFDHVEWCNGGSDWDKETKTCIVCNKKPGHTHFTLRYNGEIWDPLPPDRPGVAGYKVDSIRRFV